MKREIKFRAWTRQGEWDEDGEKRQFIMIDADSLCLLEYDILKDMLKDIEDEWYVMQFTGLKDKNGKEIYEGDILKTDNPNYGYGDPREKDYRLYTVDDLPNFYYDDLEGPTHANESEVIGNIYENPELIS